MDWSLRKLQVQQIERELKGISELSCPQSGWTKTIREILGMNTRQLGTRCDVSSERIMRIEADEPEGRTTIATLNKMAKAMNCRLVYAFVPNSAIIEFIEKTAKDKARAQLAQTSHHMALEDQQTSQAALNDQIEILKEELLKKSIKNIWDK